jgi:hypothetical protein
MSQRIPHRNHRRGNYMMTMGAFLPVLIGFAALSVDISYINMAHTQTQFAADAASHAAFVAFRASGGDVATGTAAANFILDNNLIGGERGQLDDLQFGVWDFQNHTGFSPGGLVNSAQARVARSNARNNPLQLFFAPLLLSGHNNLDVIADGVTAGLTREIIIVHDVSGSFDGLNMTNARNASVAFMDYMNANAFPFDKMGMTLFGGRIPNVDDAGQDLYDGNNFPIFTQLTDVQSGGIAVRNKWAGSTTTGTGKKKKTIYNLDIASKMNTAGNPHGTDAWTSQFRGVTQADAEFGSVRGNRQAFQAIILISDGLPTCDDSGCGSTSASDNGKVLTNTAVDNLAADGVHVWTVTFQNGSFDADFMRDLTRGLGKDYVTTNSANLTPIMLEIAASIPVVLTE